mmetsp:Transcript_42272/g.30462  ORF Transcript_42272/g.30462 Transcript_42272/m.30462 type:complete len:177 (+) Transcript_42272:1-531(+)
MDSVARNRLTKELIELSRSKDEDIVLETIQDNIYTWRGFIKGPPDSPYSEGWFKLLYTLDTNYPLNPPKIKFMTRIFHPNIHFQTGEICLEVLKQGSWSAKWTLESVTRAIVNLLLNPNADSPLNCDAGNQIREGDMLAYKTMAYMFTIEYATSESAQEANQVLKEKFNNGPKTIL